MLKQVAVNKLLVPMDSLQTHLEKFTTSAAYYHSDTEWDVQLLGSGCLLSYRGKQFLVTTSHQFKHLEKEMGQEFEFDKIGILSVENSTVISSCGYQKYSKALQEIGDGYDLIAFDYTQLCSSLPHLKHKFFDFEQKIYNPDTELLWLYMYGRAFDDQTVDPENNHICLRSRSITCFDIEDTTDEALVKCNFSEPLVIDPNGFSGGGVFSLNRNRDHFELRFSGIVSRSGKSNFFFIKAEFISRILDQFLAVNKDHI